MADHVNGFDNISRPCLIGVGGGTASGKVRPFIWVVAVLQLNQRQSPQQLFENILPGFHADECSIFDQQLHCILLIHHQNLQLSAA